jgi:N-acetylated-alpha-linked acidic dipeptidase
MKIEFGGGVRAAWWAAVFGVLVFAAVVVLGTNGAAANGPGDVHAQSQSYSFPFGEAEAKLEADFQKIPNAQQAESHLKAITASPHMAGTEGSHKVAEWLRAQYESYGFDAKIVTYSAWMPQPKEIKLELVEPEKRTLGTQEQPVAEDKDSQNKQLMPAFNAYSASGDVTAPVVYVNYGTQDDYKQLDAMGIDVAGKIVLARYGKSYRGIKAKIAEEHKAVGVLIYSDPYDDGYDAGDTFPKGPWRPSSGIQRGSVVYTQIYPGDPLTPGVAATPDAKRIAPEQAASLPKIPTLPINAQDASAILSGLTAGKVPREWQGGLPFTYHSGLGAKVHLKVEMDYRQRNLYDVIAKLQGSDDNEWVMLGNHHDAWVYGAVDPNSGTTVMLETARALGELAKKGWKPERSIVMCEWDGEEEALLGSTEWVEQNLKELQEKAVVYINTDVGVSGPNFGASATPSLKRMVRAATTEVSYPELHETVYEAWRDRVKKARAEKQNAPPDEGMMRGEEVPVGDLGAGSDFCPFFDYAGIPSIDVGFGGEYGVYHSMYDDFYWMKHFGDPTFEFHATLARVLGVLTLRFANGFEDFDFATYAARIQERVKYLQGQADEAHMDGLNLKELAKSAEDFLEAIQSVPDEKTQRVHPKVGDPVDGRLPNSKLLATEEQTFLSSGLIGRPWYKHVMFAPGSYAGYASVMMPGLTEAIWRKDTATAQQEAGNIQEALGRATTQITKAYQIMRGSAQ